MTFQVGGKLMPRITCRVGDVPRTCCETQSFPLHPPTSPLFPGPPRGTRWPRWNPDCAVDHLASYLSLSGRSLPDSSGLPWLTWVTADPVTTRPNHCRQCLHQTTSKPGFLPARNDGRQIHEPAKIEPFVRKESFVRIFS